MGILDYYFRTAKYEHLRLNGSHTVVIFVHGILSHTRKAFLQSSGNGYFWDLLTGNPPFDEFDFGLFSYGKVDVSFLLELEYPVNNLMRISRELNGYISEYKNVLFIAHSQGGLLAKTYASLFYEEQGIHLLTLHTPHRNKSFSVMRFNGSDLWDKDACYHVPHIFCGSVADTKIVKPDNAFETLHDRKYLSKNIDKIRLGHSHLSTSPDLELLRMYFQDILHFKHSGLSREFYDTSKSTHGNLSGESIIELMYSRSEAKLLTAISKYDITKTVANPWKELLENGKDLFNLLERPSSNILILSTGCSVNFITKYLVTYLAKNAHIRVSNLDCGGDSLIKSNTHMCNWLLDKRYSEPNPYKHLPFDVSDFRRGSLVENEKFLNYFINLLIKRNFSIRFTYEAGTYKAQLKDFYVEAAKDFRRVISRGIYEECLQTKNIGIERFEKVITQFIASTKKLPEKKNTYRLIYSILKKQMNSVGQEINIKGAEVIISKLYRSDGDTYWLDKYWGQLFDFQSLEKAII
ncbi:hypothetical protein [Alteromonas sp.]|uniref:hypothetical protein n=1 Tax=Alteromonas sp. TaxID=232 RepID=UPI000B6DF005|nr:hypothetical protein [Alteromonas sp.]MAI36180.1 hypothetical protein [Alteromonas sp.]OUX91768.1 MAG: hypothetical protein CBB95_01260 [Alteromonas sp. TMED35]